MKAFCPISFRLSGNLTEVSFVQPEKVLASSVLIPSGMEMLVNEEQPRNVPFPREVKPFPKVTLVNPEQFWNT